MKKAEEMRVRLFKYSPDRSLHASVHEAFPPFYSCLVGAAFVQMLHSVFSQSFMMVV